ncbi:outer membrane protein TolC [Filimonas zeae]|uniref:Membrane protein n=1 Tax=Filimonas zeae TaxID=1737353 RepID=A0A917J0I5_9BACT|nr:TolC family protein [Filimonas zeae]MDR6340696.1 outer membrane protein TolC [Filimonas zeae]GGH73940.1 membrane protein [Filimonas zeae]
MKRLIFTLSWLIAGGICLPVSGQRTADSTLQEATLQSVIQYAVTHQAAVQQALIDENITGETIKTKLADWYPQVNFNYTLQHNFQVPQNFVNGQLIQFGVNNTSNGQFTLSQALFNRDVLLAARTRGDVQLQARQNTVNNKINVTVNVSKAFYDVLATLEQIKVTQQDIVRQESSLKNAQAQYEAGTTDKTDYKRATINLNNTRATLVSNAALLKAKKEYLKYLMGYPPTEELNIVYDSIRMSSEVGMDTLQMPSLGSRIEYQQLITQRKLQEANVKYERMSFLPTATLNGMYSLIYQNNDFNKLYNNNIPNSYGNVTIGIPIFQGGKRTAKIRSAELQLKRTDWDILNLQTMVSSEYNQALANYKSSFANFQALKENLQLAQEVYDVIALQYESGIKAYIEVINAESDLRTARINYYNALYQVLASKVDVQKALGQITY